MARKNDKILDKIISFVREEAPTNNVGGGQIAGTKEAGDDPPVRKRKKKKYIKLPVGSRKFWLDDLRKKR